MDHDHDHALALRDLAMGDAGWIISRHGCLYADEAGYDATFEALVAETLAAFIRSHDPARARPWIAWRETTGRGASSAFGRGTKPQICGCSR